MCIRDRHWAVRTLTAPGDSVMVSTPVYYPFMDAVKNSGQRRLVESELKKTGTFYELDMDVLHGTVKLIFQPAEEGVRGAHAIVENGWLDDADALPMSNRIATVGPSPHRRIAITPV